MKKVTLYYQSTAWGTGFSIEEPKSGHNQEEGFFDSGKYWGAEYYLPEGFEVAESAGGGPLEISDAEGTHYALTVNRSGKRPAITRGRGLITLKRA